MAPKKRATLAGHTQDAVWLWLATEQDSAWRLPLPPLPDAYAPGVFPGLVSLYPPAGLPQIRRTIAWSGKDVRVEAVNSTGRKGRVRASDMGWSFLHISGMICVSGRYTL